MPFRPIRLDVPYPTRIALLFLAREFGFQLSGAFFKCPCVFGPVFQCNGVVTTHLFEFALQVCGGRKVMFR